MLRAMLEAVYHTKLDQDSYRTCVSSQALLLFPCSIFLFQRLKICALEAPGDLQDPFRE